MGSSSSEILNANKRDVGSNAHPKPLFVRHCEHPLQSIVHVSNIKNTDYEEWLSNLKDQKLAKDHLMLPVSYKWKGECFCSEFGELEIELENSLYSLEKEIQVRAKKVAYFQETELWYLLYIILHKQANFSHANKPSFGNIHPSNICINSKGDIEMTSNLTYPKQILDQQPTYAPPQEIPFILLQLLKKEDEGVTMRMNKTIAETFQIGLTLFSAATLTNYKSLYSTQPILTLNISKLQDQLSYWSEHSRYTVIFTSLIENLCSLNPSDRLSGPELWQWVLSHEAEIKRKGSFTFGYIPNRISQIISLNVTKSQQNLMRKSLMMVREKTSASPRSSQKVQKLLTQSTAYYSSLYKPIAHKRQHTEIVHK